jgi:UDP-N-acetylmuramate dehydrogenase
MNWLKELNAKIRYNEPLSKHTTFRIGSQADVFLEPKGIEDLNLLLKQVNRRRLDIRIIGAGSNLLISAGRIKGIVAKLSSAAFRKIKIDGHRDNNYYLQVGSGLKVAELIKYSSGLCLSGIEFLAGIPATIGGALITNAGICERAKNNRAEIKAIGDLVESVRVMDYKGRIFSLGKERIKFGYRMSDLRRYIILTAIIKLTKARKRDIDKNINRYLTYRKATQETSYPSAGCIFKNPASDTAGRLIQMLGLKGFGVGGACVSEKHANFIINKAGACASDVLCLMNIVKKKVKDNFSIELEPEIEIWR